MLLEFINFFYCYPVFAYVGILWKTKKCDWQEWSNRPKTPNEADHRS